MPAPNRSTSARDRLRGFGLGTAILTPQQLQRMYTWLNLAINRINDPTISELQRALKERLEMAGVNVKSLVPLRAFANRSIIAHDSSSQNSNTLVNEKNLGLVETAILESRQVLLKVPDPSRKHESGKKEVNVWPLQILFHNIAWYLAYESEELGAKGLIVVSRLDRIELIRVITDRVDSREKLTKKEIESSQQNRQERQERVRKSQQRLERLCLRSGGIFLGDSVANQKALSGETLNAAEIQKLLREGTLARIRFRCSPRVYAFMRTGNKRYPAEQIRLCAPLPSDDWTVASPRLDPDPQDTTHPYPVELILPAWTVDSNDFKGWLFGFGDGLKIEAPEDLRQKHLAYGQGIARLYESPEADGESSSAAEGS